MKLIESDSCSCPGHDGACLDVDERALDDAVAGSLSSAFSGALLRQRRRRAGLTIDELAALVDVTEPSVSSWERGLATPTPRHLASLAKALDITTADLCAPGEQTLGTLRVLAGFTQRGAATRSQVSLSSLARYEQGQFPTPADVCIRLANLYDVDELTVTQAAERSLQSRLARASLRRHTRNPQS